MSESLTHDQEPKAALDRLNRAFGDLRLTPAAMMVWLDALESQPHVRIEPLCKREEENEQNNIMHSMCEAGAEARKNYDRTFHSSIFDRARGMNSAAIEGDYYGQDPEPDHCAICPVLREQCLEQATHFGDRGESPPDSVCPDCGSGFGNTYSSAKDLALHRSEYRQPTDRCKPEAFELNRHRRMRLPLYDAVQLAEFEREKQAMDAQDKARKKGRGGASKKTKKN